MRASSLGVIPFRSGKSMRMKLPAGMEQRKAAQISVLPEFESVQPFGRERWLELGGFNPSILVGYGFDLQRLADKVQLGELELNSLDHAIFALTDCGTRPIADGLRANLWQVFGVPVYELIVAPGCKLLASECEAHDGWHLPEGASAYLIDGEVVCTLPPQHHVHTGLSGEIDNNPCPCGRSTLRLKNLTPHLPRPSERRLAAAA